MSPTILHDYFVQNTKNVKIVKHVDIKSVYKLLYLSLLPTPLLLCLAGNTFREIQSNAGVEMQIRKEENKQWLDASLMDGYFHR